MGYVDHEKVFFETYFLFKKGKNYLNWIIRNVVFDMLTSNQLIADNSCFIFFWTIEFWPLIPAHIFFV